MANPDHISFLSMKWLTVSLLTLWIGCYYTPRFPPSISSGFPDNPLVPICTPGWRVRHWEGKGFCPKDTKRLIQSGLDPRSLDPKSSALIIGLLHILHWLSQYIIHAVTTLKCNQIWYEKVSPTTAGHDKGLLMVCLCQHGCSIGNLMV